MCTWPHEDPPDDVLSVFSGPTHTHTHMYVSLYNYSSLIASGIFQDCHVFVGLWVVLWQGVCDESVGSLTLSFLNCS